MEVKLVSHINAESDLLFAWFQHYAKLGVHSFHIVIHGKDEENKKVLELSKVFPVTIESRYEGEFNINEKKDHLQICLDRLRNNWILLVDSDEFVEFPYKNLKTIIEDMQDAKANTLFAPMIQRLKKDGSLNSPDHIEDPFSFFPLCSINLYEKLGVTASTSKFPLFYCDESTTIQDGGNHITPNGLSTRLSVLQGVTHHFKWKNSLLNRLQKRANSTHPYRQESIGYLAYLQGHENKVPTDECFSYSTGELLQRKLLKATKTKSTDPLVNRYDEIWRDEYEKSQWWMNHISRLKQSIGGTIPSKKNFILADEAQLAPVLDDDFQYRPFTEKNEQYYGMPANDDTAIEELERLRKNGMEFFAIAWPAFWMLDHYKKFETYLREHYRRASENESVILFDLR